MKVARKFTLALIAGILVVLAASVVVPGQAQGSGHDPTLVDQGPVFGDARGTAQRCGEEGFSGPA